MVAKLSAEGAGVLIWRMKWGGRITDREHQGFCLVRRKTAGFRIDGSNEGR